MKRKIMIFVTILFVTLALNGFAHNRHHNRPCPCEQRDLRPSKDFKLDDQRKDRHDRKNSPVSIKETVNGKTAMVFVGAPLTPEETAHLQLLD